MREKTITDVFPTSIYLTKKFSGNAITTANQCTRLENTEKHSYNVNTGQHSMKL